MTDIFAILCATFLSGGIVLAILGWKGSAIKMSWIWALICLILGFSGVLKDFVPREVMSLVSDFWFWISPVVSILISYGLGTLLAAGHAFEGRGRLIFQSGLNLLFYGLFLFLYARFSVTG
jgi:hypothetical protein